MYIADVVLNMLRLVCSAMAGQSNGIRCRRTGGDDQVMDTVNTYIKETIGQVKPDRGPDRGCLECGGAPGHPRAGRTTHHGAHEDPEGGHASN